MSVNVRVRPEYSRVAPKSWYEVIWPLGDDGALQVSTTLLLATLKEGGLSPLGTNANQNNAIFNMKAGSVYIYNIWPIPPLQPKGLEA